MFDYMKNLEKVKEYLLDFRSFKYNVLSSDGTKIPFTNDDFFSQAHVESIRPMLKNAAEILSTCPLGYKMKSSSLEYSTVNEDVPVSIYPMTQYESIVTTESTEELLILLGAVENETAYDMRIQGGGVKKSFYKNYNKTDSVLASYTDLGRYDGTPLNIAGSVIIELPESVKQSYNSEQIETFVKKYIAAGETPVIIYY